MTHPKAEFLLQCFEFGIIKFGSFTLKSGIESPFYVDLRPLSSDPVILKKLSEELLQATEGITYDLICGVPYAALPMATAMSLVSEKRLIIKRKEAKKYGTKKLLEGIFSEGQKALLVEDVITSGASLLETIPEIEKEGISIEHIVVVLDREQGGKEKLEKEGYKVSTLFTISEAVEILFQNQKMTEEEYQRVKDFIKNPPMAAPKASRLSYEEKLAQATHPAAKKLLQCTIDKKSNLIASADVTSTSGLLAFAEEVGEHIVALKLHADIIKDFSIEHTIQPLKKLAETKGFLLFEDRKFGDIGSTQEMQFNGGVHEISTWADMITAHPIAGKKSFDAFSQAGVISIISMSSEGTLTEGDYVEEAIRITQEHPNAFGGVSQKKLPKDLISFTPGVHLENSGDGKGQQYHTPEKVFTEIHTDYIIVGRGIYAANDAKTAAEAYKKVGWEAYMSSLN